jgi:3-deoxy-D-manno-octulosonate 8-phosphate phosphatase (KDO 8-P phosphatase)
MMGALKNIQLIVYDFDGVLTDNRVMVREDGLESVMVHRSDGLAIALIKRMGIEQIILTTETNRIVEMRARKLGIPVIRGVDDKKETLQKFCQHHNFSLEKVIYLGNDINDLEVMRAVGYPLCPADAYDEVKRVSKEILKTQGGCGVVRELLDLLRG